ncbi:MAG: hypothetical protein GOMPHAMPRED_003688 [Gomphillus americanus]|uniref:Rhodopsin domain-containing protein n=1 Tax=Gomphillus americanus TaxID=1940652 RepID=A0A8H3FJ95_9LECA|nr:MAG: hypothetical protein GOMPHAMPRED_003688 [Gomphillus americanus]
MDKPVTAENYQIRISPEAFVIALALFLAIAFIFTVLRTVARLNQHGRLYLDDYFVFYAVIAAAACGGVAYSIRDQIYLQIYVGLGWQAPAADFQDQMLIFEKRIMACSALIWSVIYAIKFSFLAFFRKLVDRVWKLEIYWWIVMAITTACGITSIPLSFIICAHFGNDYITASQLDHERIYMNTTTALDILTDILLISIPILLLWNVRISLQRKLILGTMLCLSVLCIIIAAIRTSLANLPVNGVIDTSWLIFWQGIEAAIAVIIVSFTASRGLFGLHDAFKRGRAAATGTPILKAILKAAGMRSESTTTAVVTPSAGATAAIGGGGGRKQSAFSDRSSSGEMELVRNPETRERYWTTLDRTTTTTRLSNDDDDEESVLGLKDAAAIVAVVVVVVVVREGKR